jgi:hypothetical protein
MSDARCTWVVHDAPGYTEEQMRQDELIVFFANWSEKGEFGLWREKDRDVQARQNRATTAVEVPTMMSNRGPWESKYLPLKILKKNTQNVEREPHHDICCLGRCDSWWEA